MMILPTAEDHKRTRVPWFVWSLIAANTFIWFATVASGYRLALDNGFRGGAPDFSGALASAFLHGGFLHLAGNMFFLWTFGNAIEDSIGWLNFALAYALSHAFSILAHAMAHPHDLQVVIGASGAISGVMGLYAFLFAKRTLTLHFFLGFFRVGKARVGALSAVLAWFGMDLLFALADRGDRLGGTAYWAHLGGALMGFILGMLYDGLGKGKSAAAT